MINNKNIIRSTIIIPPQKPTEGGLLRTSSYQSRNQRNSNTSITNRDQVDCKRTTINSTQDLVSHKSERQNSQLDSKHRGLLHGKNKSLH